MPTVRSRSRLVPVDPAESEARDMAAAEGTPEERQRLAHTKAPLDKCAPEPEPQPGVFHSTRLFMVVFLSGWVMQGMFFTYFVSIITTLEKLFRIESKTTGTLLAATEIGQICTALLLTYAAGRGHRPRWIAAMMLVLALGVAGCVVPHLVYGTRLLKQHQDVEGGGAGELCSAGAGGGAGAGGDACTGQQEHSDIRDVVMPWLFACLLVVGVGQTGIATLGIPYIDDNVASSQSPLYMAITIGIRVIGPALGFLLGALCTRVYVDPLHRPPHLGPGHRDWLGAWWLGMVLVSGLIVVLSVLMFCFPRQIRARPSPPAPPLPAAPRPPPSPHKSQHIFKDFVSTIKRQLTNDILMCRTASSVLHLVPINGLYSFLPKYMETQFRLSPDEANLVAGIGGILVMGLGIITSGALILKLVPSARQVAAWTAATALLYTTGMVALMFVSCQAEPLAPLAWEHGNAAGAVLLPECGASCRCSRDKLSVVCGQDGVTYMSACHAGCEKALRPQDADMVYLSCSCVNSTLEVRSDSLEAAREKWSAATERPGETPRGGFAVKGRCENRKCYQFYLFLVLFALIMFAHASGEVGSVLLIIRCTDPQDKAMAMGVIQFAIGVFGNVPCPIVFGAVVDAACYVKNSVCGVLGACAHYDNLKFRHYFLGLTSGIMFLGFIMDVLVWHKASRIDINPEEPPAPAPALTAPLADSAL